MTEQDSSHWVPSRATLRKRLECGLPPQPSEGAERPVVPPTGESSLSPESLRILSARIDRLAVEQLRVSARVEGGLARLEQDLKDLADAPPPRESSVEVCQIDSLLIGIPSEEWRLAGYCRHRGAPEPGTLRVFRELAQPGMCVVDVGANVGIFTVAAGLEVGSSGRVFAFEPTPRTSAILRENIQLNGLAEGGTVQVRQAAISDRTAANKFGLRNSSCGCNSFYSLQEADEIIEVETTSLDEALDGQSVDLVKIDAEGAEPAILRGMRNHVAENPAITMIIELAPALLEKAGTEPSSFLRQIEEMGFGYRLVAEPGGELVDMAPEKLIHLESANLLLERISGA